jgi:hypothetical protein
MKTLRRRITIAFGAVLVLGVPTQGSASPILKYELKPASKLDSLDVQTNQDIKVSPAESLWFQSTNLASGNPPKPAKKPGYVIVHQARTRVRDHTAFGSDSLAFGALTLDGFPNLNATISPDTVEFDYFWKNGKPVPGWRARKLQPLTGPTVVVDGGGPLGRGKRKPRPAAPRTHH